jgi:ornithine cyclodeaminase/alanine dehydrogenase-like protein (mu-crystallin family)
VRSTLILTRSEIAPLIDERALVSELRQAFADYSMQRLAPARRFPISLPKPSPDQSGVMLLAPGLAAGTPAYSVKVHAKFPGNDPAIQGVIVLHDIDTGHPLAILESTLITAVRTGLAGAIGADVLAKPGRVDVAIIGAGAQGVLQLESLRHVREIDSVKVFDAIEGKAATFASRESARLGLDVHAAKDLSEAVCDADIVVTSTWARQPFLCPGMVKRGAHITTLGPDQPGKCEVDAALLKASTFACDDRDLAVEMGAIGGAGLGPDAIHAEIGEVIAGVKPGRLAPAEITVFGSVGLAFQDLITAWHVYRKAAEGARGTKVRLLD